MNEPKTDEAAYLPPGSEEAMVVTELALPSVARKLLALLDGLLESTPSGLEVFSAMLGPALNELIRGASIGRTDEELSPNIDRVIAAFAAVRADGAGPLLVANGECYALVPDYGDIGELAGDPVPRPDFLVWDDRRGEVDAGPGALSDGSPPALGHRPDDELDHDGPGSGDLQRSEPTA